MARPQPIVIPGGISQKRSSLDVNVDFQALAQLFDAIRRRNIEQREQEEFGESFPAVFAEEVPAAGPALPAGGLPPEGQPITTTEVGEAPTALAAPENIQALTRLLSGSKQGRALGTQLAAQQLAPKETAPRKTLKDAEGFQRFVDTGERVFPTAEKPKEEPKSIFGTITDISKYTPESLKKAEKSNLRSDLRVKPAVLEGIVSGKDKLTAEKDMRKEFTAISKTFRDVRDSFARVQESAIEPSPAGDLSLIFNYMKMLDPGSVVRESEFANAATAQPILDRLGISFESVQNVFEGKKLVDVARKDFIKRAKQLFNRQNQQHKKREKEFTGIAERNKLNPKNIVLDLSDPLFEINEDVGDFNARYKELSTQGLSEEQVFQKLIEEGF